MTSLRSSSSPAARAALGVTLVVAALLAAPTAAHAGASAATGSTASSAEVTPGACTDETGVTVVVDFTDLGGEVEVGCADAAATGTEALASAGFSESRDPGGFICAIDTQPDPCPTEFTGSFWSYWFAEPGEDWQMYQEGSDTAVPTPGAVEGWRYGTGDAGPTIVAPVAAAEVPAEEAEAEEQAVDAGEAADDSTSVAPAGQDPADEQGGPDQTLLLALALLAVLALAALLIARRRSSLGRGDGPRAQD
ncbi:MAG: hypothetical protein JWP95_343 [Actinotalea sp.]|nr:hypothetical protein [Actinotalea sp.]